MVFCYSFHRDKFSKIAHSTKLNFASDLTGSYKTFGWEIKTPTSPALVWNRSIVGNVRNFTYAIFVTSYVYIPTSTGHVVHIIVFRKFKIFGVGRTTLNIKLSGMAFYDIEYCSFLKFETVTTFQLVRCKTAVIEVRDFEKLTSIKITKKIIGNLGQSQ